MQRFILLCSLFTIVFVSFCAAQDTSRSWTEWSKKDAEKILNDSAWGQTFTELPPESPSSTAAVTNTRGGMAGSRSGESGEPKKGSSSLNFRARFLTAKPVREAFARLAILSSPTPPSSLQTQLQGFIDRDFGDYLVVAFAVESEDARRAAGSTMMLGRLNLEALKDRVYLERKDGKRANLIDYKAPLEDGMGAKFVFARTLDGQPFLNEGAETVRFFLQVSEKEKINLKFKVSSMLYGGKLEY